MIVLKQLFCKGDLGKYNNHFTAFLSDMLILDVWSWSDVHTT